MFLGELPKTGSDLEKHWRKLIEFEYDKSNNVLQHLYITVHPINLSSADKLNTSWWKQYFKNRLLIVNDDHHIKTAWGTRSLVDATLLMIQYAIITYGNIFEKFVLLSGTCAPIYSIKNIYDRLTQDHLSWIGLKYNPSVAYRFPYLLKQDGGYFDIEAITDSSQWIVLSKQHLDIFYISFDPNSPTYIIDRNFNGDKKITCANHMTHSIIVNPAHKNTPKYDKLSKLLIAFCGLCDKGKFILEEIDGSICPIMVPCGISDERFFQMAILQHIYDELENSNIKNKNLLMDGKPTDGFYFVINKLNIELKLDTVNTIQSRFDKAAQLSEKLNEIFSDSIEHLDIINNFAKNIKLTDSSKYITCISPPLMIGKNYDVVVTTYRHNNIKYLIKLENNKPTVKQWNDEKQLAKKNIIECNNIRANPITYANWNSVAFSPFNILRDFKLANNDSYSSKWKNVNINDLLSFTCPINLYDHLIDIDFSEIGKNRLFENFPNNEHYIYPKCLARVITFHPLEYSCWSLKNIVNCYVIMRYLFGTFMRQHPNDHTKYYFTDVYELYENIIGDNLEEQIEKYVYCDNIINLVTIERGKLSILKNIMTMKDYDKNKFGIFIKPNTLIEAWVSGALFIRKCFDGCLIDIYSDFINNLNIVL